MKLQYYIILCLLLFSCKAEHTKEQNKLSRNIVCTTGMAADLVRNICGDKANVTSLMGPGVDPHLYKASQGDLVALRKADLIVYNGLHLEGKMTEVFEKLAQTKSVIAISDFIDAEKVLKHDEYENAPDPHIWFDVSLWKSSIEGLSAYLCQTDPTNCEHYQSNAEKYNLQLDSLHNYVRESINNIPESKRILITAHDAFKYFGKAYDIQVKGLQGISTLSEFGLKDRVELVNFIIENEIHAVFVESSVSPKNIEAIVEGCQGKGHEVSIGGSLYSDAMGEEGTDEGHYIGMVKANVRHIVEGLTGKANNN